MTNLLSETTAKLESIGKAPEDIVHIGNQVYSCTWDEFTQLADFDYDSGFGSTNVPADLVILFDDGSWLERGMDWWRYVKAPSIPTNPQSIKQLNRPDAHAHFFLEEVNIDIDDDAQEDADDNQSSNHKQEIEDKEMRISDLDRDMLKVLNSFDIISGVAPVLLHEMTSKKLEDAGLIVHEAWKFPRLTESGRKVVAYIKDHQIYVNNIIAGN